MTYSVLAMTFDMLAKHKPDGIVMDWATRGEWVINLNEIKRVKKLREFYLEMKDVDSDKLKECIWGVK